GGAPGRRAPPHPRGPVRARPPRVRRRRGQVEAPRIRPRRARDVSFAGAPVSAEVRRVIGALPFTSSRLFICGGPEKAPALPQAAHHRFLLAPATSSAPA